MNIPQTNGGDNRQAYAHTYDAQLSAQFIPGKRYIRPGVNHPDGRPKILLVGDIRTRIGRNVRTSDAVHYTANTLNVRCDICDEAQADGLVFIEIAIDYRRTKNRKIFAAPIEIITTQGEKIYMDGAWQWALPKHLWLCDGHPQAQPKPASAVEQPALFSFAETVTRRGGAY